MMRAQLEIGTPQDETIVARWLDFAYGTALNAQKIKDTSKENLPEYSEEEEENRRAKRQKNSAPESQPSTSN